MSLQAVAIIFLVQLIFCAICNEGLTAKKLFYNTYATTDHESNDDQIYHQLIEPDEQKLISTSYLKKSYSCEKNLDTSKITCDPSTNSVEGYTHIIGKSSKLYTPTEEPFFRDGKYGKSIEVDAKKTASIILADQIQLNSSGFSVMDLVKKRDMGSGGIFQYINTTREECGPIVNEHIEKKVLVQMTYEEILDVIRNIKHSELYPFLSEEPRYKIADQVLSNYISDWNILQYSISKKIEISWLIKSSRLREEVDLLGYYYGPKKVNNLRTRQKLVNQKNYKSEIDNRRLEPNDKLLKAYREERSVWDDNIRKKLEEIRYKQEYAEIRNKFPVLHELFIKPLKNNSRVLGKSKRDLDW
jgi:hypothetical protein